MGLCLEGLETKLTVTTVQIHVAEDHRLIRLANALNWNMIAVMVLDDLKHSTAKRMWWVGRKLQVRIHLGVFVLQSLMKMTDRGIEEAIRGNGVYQVFCGTSIMDLWHCPAFTLHKLIVSCLRKNQEKAQKDTETAQGMLLFFEGKAHHVKRINEIYDSFPKG